MKKKIRESTAFSDIPGTKLDWDSADGTEAAGKHRKQILVAELCVELRAVLTMELLLDSSIPEFRPFNFSLLA